jgi:hypothetical protein
MAALAMVDQCSVVVNGLSVELEPTNQCRGVLKYLYQRDSTRKKREGDGGVHISFIPRYSDLVAGQQHVSVSGEGCRGATMAMKER